MCQARQSSRRHLVFAFIGYLMVQVPCTATGSAAPPEAAGPSALCHGAARVAASRTGVPATVLLAISLTETGRKRDGRFDPWPWTINMEGKGVWFDSREEAEAYALKHHARGARSFDVGCFQLNWKWHGKSFESVSAMFDPVANATYAATFLLSLYKETGNWTAAAGAYHSRTPKFATRYSRRFARIHARLGGRALDEIAPAEPDPPRENRYPLLQTMVDATRSRGSLVALSDGGAALITRSSAPLF